jgi:hypothetical protein
MNRLPLIAALAAASFSVAASAAIYRWVDGDGHVHFTDRAVPNSEIVDVRTGQAHEASSSEATTPDPNLPADQAALKKAECEQKKRQYKSYRTATKIVETDSLGRQHEYTDAEMKLLIDKAQQTMQSICSAAGISVSDTTAAAQGTSTPPGTVPKP